MTTLYTVVPDSFNKDAAKTMLEAHGIHPGRVVFISPEWLIESNEARLPAEFLFLANMDEAEEGLRLARLLWGAEVIAPVTDETGHIYFLRAITSF